MSIRRLIPHLFTAGNLVCGLLGIILIAHGKEDEVPVLVLLALLFDLLDGFLARLLKVSSELGKQLDSLADMVTFGVLPGVFVYYLLEHRIVYGEDSNSFLPLIGLLLPVFAMFRLAKFNTDSKQEINFIGLPTPAMAIFFVSMIMLLKDPNIEADSFKWRVLNLLFWKSEFLVISTIVMSVLMVLPIRIFSLKFKNGSWKGNEIRYIFLTISTVLLATLFWWALPIIIVLYIILSLINNMLTKSANDEIQS